MSRRGREGQWNKGMNEQRKVEKIKEHKRREKTRIP